MIGRKVEQELLQEASFVNISEGIVINGARPSKN